MSDNNDDTLYGILAEYETPHALKQAAKKVRDAGYRNWDTYTPFPVHGIEGAMGIKWTVLPWLVLTGGLIGCATGLGFQYWTSTVDYAVIISGKPFFSIPANIPVTFETTVLFSALTAFVGMLMLNKLPQPSSPLDLHERFSTHATDDRFYVVIEASDPKFDEDDTRELLEGTGAVEVDDVPDDRPGSDHLPPKLIFGVIVLTLAAAIPFVLIAQAQHSKSRETRIHPIPDMDWQMKFKTQKKNPFFADGRSMRPEVEGTVAVGELRDDDHFYRGKIGKEWARTFPAQVPASRETLDRGRERYDIYCAPCHGLTGTGQGIISRRAMNLAEGTWVPPTSIHGAPMRHKPVGDFFNTITNGIRNMPPYGHLINPADRWAIVMYMRALQRSRETTVADVPDRAALK